MRPLVVLVVERPGDGVAIAAAVASLVAAGARVQVVTPHPVDLSQVEAEALVLDGVSPRATPVPGAGRSRPGKAARSVWVVAQESVRAWRLSWVAWRDDAVVAAMTGADLLIAADSGAVLTVWRARRRTHAPLRTGVPAGLRALATVLGPPEGPSR